MYLEHLSATDPELASAIGDELTRERNSIELIASENFVSLSVMEAVGSPLTNKYAEGYPGRRYYGGCVNVDEIEELARTRACELFGADHANVQPHAGSQANMGVYFAVLNPHDTVLGMDLASGGHLTHGARVSFSGKQYDFVSYGVDPETERIDYDAVKKQALSGFRDNQVVVRRIKKALFEILGDDSEVERIYKIIEKQEEY